MPLNIPTFFKRLGSSVVFVAIMLTGLLWNDWSFLALVCLINFLCLREFFRLMQKVDKNSYWPGWIPPALQIGSFLWMVGLFVSVTFVHNEANYAINGFTEKGVNISVDYTKLYNSAGVDRLMKLVLYPYALIFSSAFISIAVLSKRTAWQAATQSLFGLLYIVMPLSLLILLWSNFHLLPLFMILLIWTNDTGAYLVGSFIGKTPFSPISPKKTWEGVMGGAILTIAVSIVVGYFYSLHQHEVLNAAGYMDLSITGLIVSIAGPAGDLFKSKFKRIADVKDSGNLMPGHGGALDRFDSLLMVVPFMYGIIQIASFLSYFTHHPFIF